ncbi:pyruvate dehydrogenase complex dihydrolipoamide acetyltransferase (macronuclear) [Tetrahymena thermophila SB210]|uniref:Acetyltransferase component of pyruvate dehydrogenase complex n=1 Tax=Tetrahymena thermophila (strain SB210) TaxID=312017 RepID=I7LZY0_TETTS|nr:pyruvate dehydrogenase complex dihydrolipoamide acetyltransferase [Tetrahymena thermophila SB210]EAR85117.3 pyruvate dehydrogenase complex dihydrolipoamide acetyltransferase [Tetrahymena thermophila SB210]|eukprot:XP_001032780.3 pyruvate dehydrogenase complex dihydrolipoamide acetyltransferase [Tetrahymena thermophila SB210]
MISSTRLLKRASNYLKQAARYSMSTVQKGKKTSFKAPLYQINFQSQSLSQNITYNFSSYPKHRLVALPALSPTMTEGKIAAWHIKVGQKIQEGDNIFDVQTDKDSVPNVYQEETGFVAKILVNEGELIPANTPVVVVCKSEADIPAFANFTVGGAQKAQEAPKQEQPKPAAQTAAKPAPAASSGASFPKHNVVLLPALSPTMTEGKIASFHVKVGDKVTEGDNIFDVQTDKDSVPNIYQEASGFVAKILVKEGETIPANHPVLVVVAKKDDLAKFEQFTLNDALKKGSASSAPQEAAQPAQTSSAQTATQTTVASGSSGRVAASPYAKTVAQEKGVDLSTVQGSGPNGRIIAKDVQNATTKAAQQTVAAQQPAAETKQEAPKPAPQQPKVEVVVQGGVEYQKIPITPMRKTIAERLVQSKTTVPHFYLNIDVQMDEVLHLRKTLNEQSTSKISVNDLIVKASALALRDMPGVNSQWHGDHIRQFKHADVAVAVSTKTGLITPIVFNAETLGLSQISSKTKELAEKARKGGLLPTEYQGGTFTISNLGMYGIDHFAAIVNPPHGTILAVGATSQKVVPDNDPHAKYPFKTIQSMTVTLSCDHRVVDGALGAEWLQKFKGYLEKPYTMLL